MKRKYKLYQVDAFTKEKFTGNPAGVVIHADGLTEVDMQQIARELNNSETAFLFDSDDPTYDVHTRYFTPTSEVPICGHATIASQFIWAKETQSKSPIVYNKTGAGILPVEIEGDGGETRVVMTQGAIEFGAVLAGEIKTRLLSALHITEQDLIDCPIQIVSTGHSKVMVGIKSKVVLNALAPDMTVLTDISQVIGCNGFYVFVLGNSEDDILVCGRMFAPAIGITEDPVTGNANGPLGAYLIHYGLVTHEGDHFSFKALQGEAIKRPGVVRVQVELKDGQSELVKVSGEAVVVFESFIEL
ncbi:MAG: PhzF family isomerase [Clostridia bacterium]|nr:PhzF family isomerase [Clostridia bacterium]